jgi:hypothetical protein
MKRFRVIAAVVGLTVLGGATTAAATAGSQAVGTLNLSADLRLVSNPGPCPSNIAAEATCAARTIAGPFPGLGQVASEFNWVADIGPPACAGGFGKALAYPMRLAVSAKGDLLVTAAEGAQCIDQEAVRAQTQTYRITGGTGIYAGASGSGSFEQVLAAETATGRVGRQTWTGSLTVPGLDFDMTAPTFSGAAPKTVTAKKGAKSVRVTYQVTAQDDKDGSVPATCSPRSGFRFRIGKTKVTCQAVDSSANSASASFTVTVKRAR